MRCFLEQTEANDGLDLLECKLLVDNDFVSEGRELSLLGQRVTTTARVFLIFLLCDGCLIFGTVASESGSNS